MKPDLWRIRSGIVLLALVVALVLAVGSGGAWAGVAHQGSATQPQEVGDLAPARAWEGTFALPAYLEGPPNPNPPFDYFHLGRLNYPYTIRDNVTDRREARNWRALFLENEYLRCVVLPDFGGHLYSCTDKVNNAEVFYANPSIKLAKIAYRGAWAAFGIEFNYPVSHNWMTASPVDFAVTEGPDGSASVWIGNIDRVYGTQWRTTLTLRPGRSVLEQHTTLYNRSDLRHRFYWWTNAAVEAWDDTQIIYPMEVTASHGFRDLDTWPVDSRGTDNSTVGNHIYGPVSRFSHGSREPWMAVYHPRTRAGVVHYSSPTDLPAKKIWSWGSDPRGLAWRTALSDNDSAYVEIQRGLFRNQETYGFLEPQDAVSFTEYWMPIRQIGDVSRANPEAVLFVTRSEAPGGARAVDPAGPDSGPKATAGPRPPISRVSLDGPLHVAMNVTRDLPDAWVIVLQDGEMVTRQRVSMTPAATFVAAYPELISNEPYTIELRDAERNLLLRHTEGHYDMTPVDEFDLGEQPPTTVPPAAERTDGDWLEFGTEEERQGRRLEALDIYRGGLGRYPDNFGLNKAAGRLAVILKQFDAAVAPLEKALAQVSSDYEAHYYRGMALLELGRGREARTALERSQSYGTFRSPSLIALAGLAAREGDTARALELLAILTEEDERSVRGGGLEIALLRATGRTEEARAALERWLEVDPTSSFLRHEAVLLGLATDGAGSGAGSSAGSAVGSGGQSPRAGAPGTSDALWRHLAADPERILEIVVDYMRVGLYADAIELLARRYPEGAGVVSEPGMPRPEDYPLIAYYRGYCRQAIGESGGADFDAASSQPTTYVFPNRPRTAHVLRAALAHDPDDATARFLLGSWYLSGGMAEAAMNEWAAVRRLDPSMPVLHFNMGYTALRTGGSPDRAVELFREGTTVDSNNIGLYFGLEEAMTEVGESAGARADAILTYPDLGAMPPDLVFSLARLLTEAQRFDEADRLFYDRFFAREEGGTNVREVYLEVKLGRAGALAAAGRCAEALGIIDGLAEPVAELDFTQDGVQQFIDSERFQEMIGAVLAACR